MKLLDGGGDCEDLSILYASLLQALNIKSSVIIWLGKATGHSFVAFDGDEGQSVYMESTSIGAAGHSYVYATQLGAADMREALKEWWGSIRLREAFDEGRQLPAWSTW